MMRKKIKMPKLKCWKRSQTSAGHYNKKTKETVKVKGYPKEGYKVFIKDKYGETLLSGTKHKKRLSARKEAKSYMRVHNRC